MTAGSRHRPLRADRAGRAGGRGQTAPRHPGLGRAPHRGRGVRPLLRPPPGGDSLPQRLGRRRRRAADHRRRRVRRGVAGEGRLEDACTSTPQLPAGATLDVPGRSRGARALPRLRRADDPRSRRGQRRPTLSFLDGDMVGPRSPGQPLRLRATDRQPRHAPRRRPPRRRAAHLVELRLQLARAHRGGQARLEGGRARQGARRRRATSSRCRSPERPVRQARR